MHLWYNLLLFTQNDPQTLKKKFAYKKHKFKRLFMLETFKRKECIFGQQHFIWIILQRNIICIIFNVFWDYEMNVDNYYLMFPYNIPMFYQSVKSNQYLYSKAKRIYYCVQNNVILKDLILSFKNKSNYFIHIIISYSRCTYTSCTCYRFHWWINSPYKFFIEKIVKRVLFLISI